MRARRAAPIILLAAIATSACTQERAPLGQPTGVGVGVGAGAQPPGGDGGGGGGGGGTTGTAGAPPEVADCACLAATRDPGCQGCLEEATAAACSGEAAACDAAEAGYCGLVLECAAHCPSADAFCVDACLGADDTSRRAVEELVACACAACAGACGEGGC